jgi:hypothetical protein
MWSKTQIDAEARKPVNAGKVVDVSLALRPLDDVMRYTAAARDSSLFAKLLEIKTELTSTYKPFRTRVMKLLFAGPARATCT